MVTAAVYKTGTAYEELRKEYLRVCGASGLDCAVSQDWALDTPLGRRFAEAEPDAAEKVLAGGYHLLERYNDCHGPGHDGVARRDLATRVEGESVATSVYNTPDNVVELLDRVLNAALGTRFYGSILGGQRAVGALSDFAGVPITPIADLRGQALADVVPNPDRVGWVFGRYRGRSRRGGRGGRGSGRDCSAVRHIP